MNKRGDYLKKIVVFLFVFALSIVGSINVFAEEKYKDVAKESILFDYDLKKGDVLSVTYSLGNDPKGGAINIADTTDKKVFKTLNMPPHATKHTEKIVLPYDMSGLRFFVNFTTVAFQARVYDIKLNDKLLFDGEKLFVYEDLSNLTYVATHDSISFTWDNPPDKNGLIGTQIFRDGQQMTILSDTADVWVDKKVFEDTSYTYKFVPLYNTPNVSLPGITQVVTTKRKPLEPSEVPPNAVTALTAVPTAKTVKLSWKLPNDEDLAGIQVLKDGNMIADLPVTDKYEAIKLSPSTNYQFTVKAYDLDGNESPSAVVNATTLEGFDEVAPAQPKGVTVTGGNNALYIKWAKNTESDLFGYDVYVDGQKVNSSIVKNNFYNIGDLVNDQPYTVMVVAVDITGNESLPSNTMTGTPITSGLPLLKTDYDLKDVTTGVSEWFSSYWLIIAFASAIPLSFYVASRLKLLFLER
jgi:hypothetical protein